MIVNIYYHWHTGPRSSHDLIQAEVVILRNDGFIPSVGDEISMHGHRLKCIARTIKNANLIDVLFVEMES